VLLGSACLQAAKVCVTNLDYQSELLIFEFTLTTFKQIIVFSGSWSSIENWLKPKIKPPSGNLACRETLCSRTLMKLTPLILKGSFGNTDVDQLRSVFQSYLRQGKLGNLNIRQVHTKALRSELFSVKGLSK